MRADQGQRARRIGAIVGTGSVARKSAMSELQSAGARAVSLAPAADSALAAGLDALEADLPASVPEHPA